jgi:hypothetical protein
MGMNLCLCPWCNNSTDKNINGFCSVKCKGQFEAMCDAQMTEVVNTISEHHTKDDGSVICPVCLGNKIGVSSLNRERLLQDECHCELARLMQY